MTEAPPQKGRVDLAHNLILPTILFGALGAMTWAIRGCSGFGGTDGCIFAGVTWGAAWWFVSREPGGTQSRPYSSGWIILALTIGIGLAGSRGWMQWPSFFDGHLQTNTPEQRWVPISRSYGFLWLFIAGVPWAGLGACLLAWCGSHGRLRPWEWALRIGCGALGGLLARWLFASLPDVFLPLHQTLQAQYADLHANPNLRRLINDNRAAIMHLGIYLGFLACEIGRRDWRNVTLISTVGIVNGLGWALWQNWRWAPRVWPDASFNWWRCWESSGGISIGVAYGLAFFLANRPFAPGQSRRCVIECPNLDRFGAWLGLFLGLSLSVRNGLKGWANIYLGNEEYWSALLWKFAGPLIVLGLVALVAWELMRPLPRGFRGEIFPHAYAMIWTVLLTQNLIAQLVTGPLSAWKEVAFSIYYVLLFLISAPIVHHFHCLKSAAREKSESPKRESTGVAAGA